MNKRVADVCQEIHFDLANESSSVVLLSRLKAFYLYRFFGQGLGLRPLGDKLLLDILFVK